MIVLFFVPTSTWVLVPTSTWVLVGYNIPCVMRSVVKRLGFGTWTGGAIAFGYFLRCSDEERSHRQLPSGWRTCCEARQLTEKQEKLQPKLCEIVGPANVQVQVDQKGSRLGRGVAYAVVRPGTLQQCLDCLQACVDADVTVLPQGANTGLTGGSVPRGYEHGVDRPTVVINLSRLDSIIPIDGGKRLVCLAGAGIHSVRQEAAKFGRESHSVLGSIFLNPTTAAGVAFGSGGTQLRKGPVYTERLLYARVNERGEYTMRYTTSSPTSASHRTPDLNCNSHAAMHASRVGLDVHRSSLSLHIRVGRHRLRRSRASQFAWSPPPSARPLRKARTRLASTRRRRYRL